MRTIGANEKLPFDWTAAPLGDPVGGPAGGRVSGWAATPAAEQLSQQVAVVLRPK